MTGVFTAARIRAAELAHGRELADGTLMQRASHALAKHAIAALQEASGGVVGRSVAILVGGGNNGGDALHAGARLAQRGALVHALLVADRHHAGGAEALVGAGGRILPDCASPAAHRVLANADLVLDGILGIGAQGAPREPARSLLAAANCARGLRIAVDLPTGVDADTGAVAGVAFQADRTVTFAALKPGLLLAPGKAHSGQVQVVDIGVDDALSEPVAWTMDEAEVAEWVPSPGFDDHKYRRGVVGVAAGSHDYRGAALLCVQAALAGPTGMTALLDRRDGVAELVVSRFPEVVRTDRVIDRVTGWVCGPGFPATPADEDAVAAILRTPVPVVLDAGALTLLAASAQLRGLVRNRAAPTILTPHEGEFARLDQERLDQDRLDQDRLDQTAGLAQSLEAVVVRKGPGTIVMAPDGTCLIDRAGTSALSTAGSGDVLAGCIASLLACAWAQGRLDDAAQVARAVAAGCWLHGMAGRAAARVGLPTASSLARELHLVTGRVSHSPQAPAIGRIKANRARPRAAMGEGLHAR